MQCDQFGHFTRPDGGLASLSAFFFHKGPCQRICLVPGTVGRIVPLFECRHQELTVVHGAGDLVAATACLMAILSPLSGLIKRAKRGGEGAGILGGGGGESRQPLQKVGGGGPPTTWTCSTSRSAKPGVEDNLDMIAPLGTNWAFGSLGA